MGELWDGEKNSRCLVDEDFSARTSQLLLEDISERPSNNERHSPAPHLQRQIAVDAESTSTGASATNPQDGERPAGHREGSTPHDDSHIENSRSITLQDGSCWEFEFRPQDQRCIRAIHRYGEDPPTHRWDYNEANNTYTRTIPGRPAVTERGTLNVNDDGTVIFRSADRPDQFWQTSLDGSLSVQFQAGGITRRMKFTPDGGTVTSERVNGQFRIQRYQTPETDALFRYRIDGELSSISMTENRELTVYTARSDGLWTMNANRNPDGLGRLEAPSYRLTLVDGARPIFRRMEPADSSTQRGESNLAQGRDMTERGSSRGRVLELQQRLANLAPVLAAIQTEEQIQDLRRNRIHEAGAGNGQQQLERFGEEVRELATRQSAALETERAALARETEAIRNGSEADISRIWANCPVSQHLYRRMVQWLQGNLREVVREPGQSNETNPLNNQSGELSRVLALIAGAHATDVPPGALVREITNDDQPLTPERIRSLARGGRLAIDLGIHGMDRPDRPVPLPGERDLTVVGNSLGFLIDARRSMDATRLHEELTNVLPQIIRDPENHLPQGWLNPCGLDPVARRDALRDLIDLAQTATNYVQSIAELRRSAHVAVPPVFSMPPGAEPEYDANGRLVRANLLLPQDLDMQNPENLHRCENIRRWLREVGPPLQNILRQYEQSLDPARMISFGEMVTDGRVLCDPAGRPLRILRSGEDPSLERHQSIRQFNVLDCGYTVERRRARGEEGIYVTTRVLPKQANFYDYLNITANPVTGNRHLNHAYAFTETRGPFRPDEQILIRDPEGRVSIIPARQLESQLRMSRFTHYGSKMLTATMDIGMTVSSLASLGTATPAMLASRAAWAAGRSVTGALAARTLPAAMRLGIGASGLLLHNASAETDPSLHGIRTLHGAAMTLDVAQGTLRQIGRGALGLVAAGLESSRAQALERHIHDAIAASRWMTGIHHGEQAAHAAMEVTNYPYTIIQASEITRSIQEILRPESGDPFQRAQDLTERGVDRILNRPEAIAQETFLLQRQRAMLAQYANQLCRAETSEVGRAQVNAILRNTSRLLEATDEDRATYASNLLEYIYGEPQTAVRAALASRATPQSSSAGAVHVGIEVNGEALHPFEIPINENVRAAALAALLYLNSQSDVQSTLAQRQLQIPEHVRRISTAQAGTSETIGARTETQTISRAQVLDLLRNDVRNSDSPPRRLVAGDLLVRSHDRPPLSYVGILRDTLTNNHASDSDRIDALMCLAPFMSALRMHELAGGQRGELNGVTIEDLRASVERLASNQNASRSVRCMSAACLYVVRSSIDGDQARSNMDRFSRLYAQPGANGNAFADRIMEQLRTEASGTDLHVRFNAIAALRDLGNLTGMQNDADYNQALLACMTPQNPTISLQAFSRLHGRLHTLSMEQRMQIIGFLRPPLTTENQELRHEILANLVSVLPSTRSGNNQERDLHQRALAYLATGLDRDRVAGTDPEYRRLAVRLLGELSSQNNRSVFDRVAEHLDSNREPAPAVRLAAANAVERLAAPGDRASSSLHQLAIRMLQSERDPSVRERLYSMQSHNTRPVRNTNYIRAVHSLESALGRPRTFDVEATSRFLETNSNHYDLLTAQGFRNALGNANNQSHSYWSDPSWWVAYLSGGSAPRFREAQALAEINRVPLRRIEQFHSLASQAAQNNEEGSSARSALQFFALGENPPFEPENVNTFRLWAAQAIESLCRPGVEVRGEFLPIIHQALLRNTLPAATRQAYLRGLCHFAEEPGSEEINRIRASFLAHPDATTIENVQQEYSRLGITLTNPAINAMQNYAQLPRDQRTEAARSQTLQTLLMESAPTRNAYHADVAAEIIFDVLQHTSGAFLPGSNHSEFEATRELQRDMLRMLERRHYRQGCQVLEPFASSHPDPEIRHLAGRVLADMRDRIEPVWQRTSADNVSTIRQRQENLERLLLDQNSDADDVVQGMFAAVRGRPLERANVLIDYVERALRDGGIVLHEQPEASPGPDGGEKVRLAAARIILDRNAEGQLVNTGFSLSAQRRAVEEIIRTAFASRTAGYRQDALNILNSERRNNPSLVLLALRDAVMREPDQRLPRTIEINGELFTARTLLEHDFAQVSHGQQNHTDTIQLDAAGGTLTQSFIDGRLSSSVERLRDGRSIVTRSAPGGELVIEEFTGNHLSRAVAPHGKRYPEVLLAGVSAATSFDESIELVRRLLTEPAAGATYRDRQLCMSLVNSMATTGNPDERLRWAEYLACSPDLDGSVRQSALAAATSMATAASPAGSWLAAAAAATAGGSASGSENSPANRRWRDLGIVAISDLASSGGGEAARSAESLLSRFTPEQLRLAATANASALSQRTSTIESQSAMAQQARQNFLDSNNPSRRQALQNYLQAIGQNRSENSRVARSDTDFVLQTVHHANTLYRLGARSPQDQSLIIDAYVTASRTLDSRHSHPAIQSAERTVENIISEIGSRGLIQSDPRTSALLNLIGTEGCQSLKLRLLQALLNPESRVEQSAELYRAIWPALGRLLTSNDANVRGQAIQALSQIQATTPAQASSATMALLRGAPLTNTSRQIQLDYWSGFQSFLERSNTDRSSPVYQLVTNRVGRLTTAARQQQQ